jgi:hypothetical protein
MGLVVHAFLMALPKPHVNTRVDRNVNHAKWHTITYVGALRSLALLSRLEIAVSQYLQSTIRRSHSRFLNTSHESSSDCKSRAPSCPQGSGRLNQQTTGYNPSSITSQSKWGSSRMEFALFLHQYQIPMISGMNVMWQRRQFYFTVSYNITI